jgi:hypothetical protein
MRQHFKQQKYKDVIAVIIAIALWLAITFLLSTSVSKERRDEYMNYMENNPTNF